VYSTLFFEERTIFRKDAPKQANFEELAFDEKATIYRKTAFSKKLVHIGTD
jgi:hypothetical protein